MPERIIVFTMEKVGSSTVKWALEHAGYLVDRVTPHNMWEFDDDLCSQKVITMIRDPFAHAHSLAAEYGKFPEFSIHRTFMVETLEHFVKINPYKYYFDRIKGWQIYDERLLLIRTESLTAQLWHALITFLGPNHYLIDHRAKGFDRFGPDYLKGPQYKFLDQELINRVYDEGYMKHFYTDEEIEGFKQRWLK